VGLITAPPLKKNSTDKSLRLSSKPFQALVRRLIVVALYPFSHPIFTVASDEHTFPRALGA